MKIAGAGLILISALLTSRTILCEGKERSREYRALQSALTTLRALLSEKQTPLPLAFMLTADKSEQAATAHFFSALKEKMSSLGEERFSVLWQESVRENLAFLGSETCTLLEPLGDLIGGSELEMQCEALRRTAESFAELAAENDKCCSERRRMTLGLSFTLGTFVIILLI